MVRISLCLIARDEEQLLPGCLASVRGAVDEIVLVDTGSADATREIARAAGARVVEQPWRDDFAAPRNEALRHASGDFVLQLDADERLAPGAAAALRAAAERADLDVAMLRLHDAVRLDAAPADVLSGRARIGPPFQTGRLFRHLPGLEYRGAVHESIDDALAALAARIRGADADIIHLGNIPELRRARGKDDRNLRLLRLRCQREAEDITPFGYLALELVQRGEAEEAARRAEEGWARVAGQPRHRSVHRLALARAAAALALGAPGRALDTMRVATARMGRRADFDFISGMALEALALCEAPGPRRESLAREAAGRHGRAAERDADPVAEQLVRQASPEGCALRRGCALLVAGAPGEALAAFRGALGSEATSQAATIGAAEATALLGDPARALAALEPLLGEGPDAWVVAADAARRLGGNEEARLLLARARERARAGFISAHRREALLADAGRRR